MIAIEKHAYFAIRRAHPRLPFAAGCAQLALTRIVTDVHQPRRDAMFAHGKTAAPQRNIALFATPADARHRAQTQAESRTNACSEAGEMRSGKQHVHAAMRVMRRDVIIPPPQR